MRRTLGLTVAVALLAALSGPAGAAIVVHQTFMGEDIGPGDSAHVRLASHPTADAARNDFFSMLTLGVGTEDFESFAGGHAAPLILTFPGSLGTSITATLTGGGGTLSEPPPTLTSDGRYGTSGSIFWNTTQDFAVDFSAPVAAFGFYGIDIGDYGGQLTLTLTGGGGGSRFFNVGNMIRSSGQGGAGVLYYGIIDTDGFTHVEFGNTKPNVDYFGFDDMTIGDIRQIQPSTPEPATMVLLGLGLGGMALRRFRKSA